MNNSTESRSSFFEESFCFNVSTFNLLLEVKNCSVFVFFNSAQKNLKRMTSRKSPPEAGVNEVELIGTMTWSAPRATAKESNESLERDTTTLPAGSTSPFRTRAYCCATPKESLEVKAAQFNAGKEYCVCALEGREKNANAAKSTAILPGCWSKFLSSVLQRPAARGRIQCREQARI